MFHYLGLLSAEVALSCSFEDSQLYMSSLIAAIINFIIRSIIIIIIIIIILRGGYRPFQKVKHKNEAAMSIIKNFKNNSYLVSRILDNSLKVWILYLPAC